MPTLYEINDFSTYYRKHKISIDRWSTKGQLDEIILLHGGGKSSKKGFQNLRNSFIDLGLGTLSFDFLGHGQSEGNLEGFSLKDRVDQVITIIDEFSANRSDFNIMGFSMGAYVATMLTQYYKVSRLGLVIPAMYNKEAFEVPFGPEFSKIIRKPNSWLESDGYQIISQFTGNLLIVSAERDAVVPARIPELLFENSKNTTWKEHFIIPDGTHNLSKLVFDAPHHRYSLLHNIFNWYFHHKIDNEVKVYDY